MRLIQRLRGGDIGVIFRAAGRAISIGRENNDVNFPDDPFISGRHAQVSISADGRFTLTDIGSKNGTFIRIGAESALATATTSSSASSCCAWSWFVTSPDAHGDAP